MMPSADAEEVLHDLSNDRVGQPKHDPLVNGPDLEPVPEGLVASREILLVCRAPHHIGSNLY